MPIRILLFLFASALISLSSCVTEGQLLKTYRKSPVYNGFNRHQAVNGVYANLDTSGANSLLRDLWSAYSRKGYSRTTHALDSALIVLHYDGDRLLTVDVRSRDTTFRSFTLKVKNKGQFLSVKHRLFLIPIPFCYFQSDNKELLFIDEAGRLISVHGFDGGGWVLFMVAGNKWSHATAHNPVRDL
jgi:hypothetical protein